MSFRDKSPGIRNMMDRLAIIQFGRTVTEAMDQGVCVRCGQTAAPRCITTLGQQEYEISGLCEVCYDEITR